MFKRGVITLDKDSILELNLKGSGMYEKYLQPTYDTFDEKHCYEYMASLEVHDTLHLCHTCLRYLEKEEMPPLCWKNSLDYMETPECLQLTNMEKQLIAKSLVFIKIRQLPVSRMDSMNDR